MANAKTISFVDAVQEQARKELLANIRVMLEPVREVIKILDQRTNDLNNRVKALEQAFKDAARDGEAQAPQVSDAS